MLTPIKSVIPAGITYQQIEKGTEIIHEGEPFIVDYTQYSTYLFVCRKVYFLIQATSFVKAMAVVEELKEFSEFDWQNEKYALVNVTNQPGWASWSLDRSNVNQVVNGLAKSLFDIDI